MITVGKDVEKLEPPYIAGESVQGAVTLENHFESSSKC